MKFLKIYTYQEISRDANKIISGAASRLSRVEGMEGLAFLKVFQDLEDPNTLFLAAVFEDDIDMDKYTEVGPNQAYSDAVAPLVESFDLAMSYEVSKATALYS